MASAVTRSFQLIAAFLVTGACAAQAQTASKAWVDPGAVERSKAQTAAPAAATSPAEPAKVDAAKVDAAKGDAAKGAAAKASADPKQTDSEKLKELIRAAEAAPDADKTKTAAPAHAAHHHARAAVAHHAAPAPHAHAAARKVAAKAAKHPAPHYAYHGDLPNKKDGPVEPSSGLVRAAY